MSSVRITPALRQTLPPHVPETSFGLWFLRSRIWTNRVLERALQDVDRLIPNRRSSYPVVIDVGCGFGRSLPKLAQRFRPQRLIGIDIEAFLLEAAAGEAARAGIAAEFIQCSSEQLQLSDASVDLLFCHQTFHHLIEQEAAIREFYRVLKPGGVMLFAESTKRYIHSWIIRLLFRHPMHVQKTAEQYLALIRGAGFEVKPEAVSYPYLWWSREDFGIMEHCFGIQPPKEREETLLNLVAIKPQALS